MDRTPRTVPAPESRAGTRADDTADGGRLWEKPGDLATAVKNAQAGDEAAFGILYSDMQPRMLRYLRALVGTDAEDVASETWLNVARDLRAFQGDSDGFRGWVATIARNRATDHLRHVQRRPQPASVRADELQWWAASDNTEDNALESVSTDAAIELISQLPRDQAEAVLLRVVMGLDAANAGKVLGKRAGAVRTASYRGLRRLSGIIASTGEIPASRSQRSGAVASRQTASQTRPE